MNRNPEGNLAELRGNPYPGRGIIVGMDETGRYLIQLYWIMGRTENSRNRVFEYANGRLKTAAVDPSKVKDPSLIIYSAMREYGGHYIVSNGDQTDTVFKGLRSGQSFQQSLADTRYEPDEPNYTPRITAISSVRDGPTADICVIRKNGNGLLRTFWPYRLDETPGIGYCVTTYEGDGNPVPSFTGHPYPLPLVDEGDELLRYYWNVLNIQNRVAIALKVIEARSGVSSISVINKYEKVAA